ncbi:palmitoyl-protein thioesterase ABHD10, mitochondrial-like [Liolophura sinensis]|uniref:palmitoyl-protein thioesterase ABHD10, mitochondrial-like n=1 Tax=Liolophura sinensis TaxID=3198878 RepID=UPI0031590347
MESAGNVLQRTARGSLAYVQSPGQSPGVMFCCGYGSDMSGTKALALEDYCRRNNRSFVRFDYTRCGKSDGDFNKSTLGEWKEDALDVLDQVAQGPQVIVGSSMGGWLMLFLAMERQERVKALVGVAAAPDFTRWRVYSEQVLEDLKTKGVAYYETPYGTMSISRKFLEESESHWLLNKAVLNITCPVRLLHGMKDDSVPYDISLQVADKVVSENVEVLLRKSGDHRLSTPEDILLLTQTLDKLLT